ncbi:hypothetical protein TSUD_276870 [Trifolium subterraneum]|uniref:Uncharacterized protein n=1 Tax=Trifolium subterraneum TaxID=3900 RepID=A0A2Z6N1E2_TRISU|nr:hypothetical protein TSUD_276870 [Trifolium subterraneum]
MTLTQIQVEPVVRPVDEFIFNTPRITLQCLKDATTVDANTLFNMSCADLLAANQRDLISLTGSSSKAKGKEIVSGSTAVEVSRDLLNKFSDTVVNLADDSLGTQEIEEDIYSKVSHSLKEKGKEIVVEGTPVGNIDQVMRKDETVVTTIAGESAKSGLSVITQNETAAIHGKGAKSMKDILELSGVVDLDNDCVQTQQDDVTPNQLAAKETKGSRSKKYVKRVSPQKEDEDENAPIKLLKRAIKIEKIV